MLMSMNALYMASSEDMNDFQGNKHYMKGRDGQGTHCQCFVCLV